MITRQAIINPVVSYLYNHPSSRRALLLLLSYRSGDVPLLDPKAREQLAFLLSCAPKNVKALHSTLKQIGHNMDATLDSMPLDQLLGLGEVHLGDKPSPFLQNPRLLDEKGWDALLAVAKRNMISESDLISFGNIMAHLVVEEAKAAKDFHDHPSVHARQKMSEAHLLLDGVLVALITHISTNHKTITPANGTPPDHNTIRNLYPKAFLIGEQLQLLDDMSDVLIDLRSEHAHMRTSPNAVLTLLYERGQLYDDKGKLLPDLARYVEMEDKGQSIEIRSLPHSLQTAIKDIHQRQKESVRSLAPLQQSIIECFWQTQERNGLALSNGNSRLADNQLRNWRDNKAAGELSL